LGLGRGTYVEAGGTIPTTVYITSRLSYKYKKFIEFRGTNYKTKGFPKGSGTSIV
jgi:hypothetical protein